MTDLHSGNARTSPMAGTLAGLDTDLRVRLARLDRERRSWLTRPSQQAAAVDRFVEAVGADLEKVRGADRVAAQRTLAMALDEASKLREALADAIAGRKAATKLADSLRDELTETRAELQGQLAIAASHQCEPLPQRVRQTAAPEPQSAPQAPRTAAKPRSRAAASGRTPGSAKAPGSLTEPQGDA